MTELASLGSSLPCHWASTVAVRVDEDRMDVLQALVIGPDETPYANGIFIFDIHLPTDYPHTPPLVHLLTTGQVLLSRRSSTN